MYNIFYQAIYRYCLLLFCCIGLSSISWGQNCQLNINAGADQNLCQGESVQLYPNVSGISTCNQLDQCTQEQCLLTYDLADCESLGTTIYQLTSDFAYASGSGNAGVPKINNFDIPNGTDRLLIYSIAFERDHCYWNGENWESAVYNEKYPTITYGGVPMKFGGRTYSYQYDNNNTATDALFSMSTYWFYLFENDLPNSGDFKVNNINLPDCAGDEAVAFAKVFNNVDSWKGLGSDYWFSDDNQSLSINASPYSNNQPNGTQASENFILGLGTISTHHKNYTIGLDDYGWVSANSGQGKYDYYSEKDGLLHIIQGISLTSSNQNISLKYNGNEHPLFGQLMGIRLVAAKQQTDYDFSEFTPDIENNICGGNVSATFLNRPNGKHSCTPGVNGTDGVAMCTMTDPSCNFNNLQLDPLTFSVTMNPQQTAMLNRLEFYEASPNNFDWIDGASGPNNYATRYGIRVLKDGNQIYQQDNITSTQAWTLESFDFSNNPAFMVEETCTFTFELIGYCPVGNGADISVWDIDNIKLYGKFPSSSNPGANGEPTYSWSNGANTPAIIANQGGQYCLTVTDCNGCQATDCVNVNIANINAVASNNGPLTCTNNSVQLSATGANNATYSWTGPNGFVSNQQNPTVSNPGTYTLTVNLNGCSDQATTTVALNNNFNITASNSGSLNCTTNTAVQLSANGPNNASYIWSGPNGFSSNLQSPIVSDAGIYTVTASINGCTAQANTTVTLDNNINLTVSNTGPLTCATNTIQLNVIGPNNASYSWTGPNGFVSNQQNPVVSDPGLYTVSVTTNGCTAQAIANVLFEDDLNITASNSGSLNCTNNTSVQLSVNGPNNASYSWIGPNGFVSNLQNPIVSNAGTYTVTASINGCTDQASTTVALDNNINVTASNNGPLDCTTNTVQLSANAPNNATYSWTGPNGFVSNQQSPSVLNPGTYTLTITSNGCTAQASTNVVFEDCPRAGLGNFTFADVNGDGMYMTSDGDFPIGDVWIYLYNANNLDTPIDSTVSDDTGYYEFIDLDPSINYVVQFESLDGFSRTTMGGTASDGIDDKSDANQLDGFTDIIDLNPGEFDPTIDAGYIPFRGTVDIKVLLEGAADGTGGDPAPKPAQDDPMFSNKNNASIIMHDLLREQNLIPLSNPYTTMSQFNHTGTESITQSVLNVSGNNAIVDWVLIEFYNANDPTQLLASQAALLQRDGDIVDTDGISSIESDLQGSYYIAIRHRNHLGIMTLNPITIGETEASIDFTNPTTPTYGNNAQKELNGLNALWAGDADCDGKIVFQGNGSEVNTMFFEVMSDVGNVNYQTNFVCEGYNGGDVNLSGQTIYQGINNGPNLVFFQVLTHLNNSLAAPNFIIYEQIPKP